MATLLPAAPYAGARPSSGASVALRSIAGFWLFYFVLNSLRMAVTAPGEHWELLPRRAAVVLIGMGLSWLFYHALRPLDGAPLRARLIAAFLGSVPVALAYALVNHAAFYLVLPGAMQLAAMERWAEKDFTSWKMIVDQSVTWYFFVVAWAVLHIALSYAAQVSEAERRVAAYRAEAQSAQLRALRWQINPHFLFNTLNALSSLVLRRADDEAERMILNLSTFFRTSLTVDPAADLPLEEELRLQRLYLDIEQVRFPERLRVAIDLPNALRGAAVPGLILQPLVENAIKHGVSRSNRPVTLAIRARADGGRLRLEVADDADPQGAPAAGTGVGVANVCSRLRARFGDAAHCRSGPRPGGGWAVELVFPLEHHG